MIDVVRKALAAEGYEVPSDKAFIIAPGAKCFCVDIDRDVPEYAEAVARVLATQMGAHKRWMLQSETTDNVFAVYATQAMPTPAG